MKSLNQFIKESANDFKKAIEEFAWGIIDEFNQEGVVGFDESDWKAYVAGKKEPEYKEIVDEIIAQYNEYAGTRYGKMYDTPQAKKAIEFLKDYDKNKKDIDTIILRAGNSYINNI